MVHIPLITLVLAATAYAVPQPAPLDHFFEERAPQSCVGQSCAIADLSRSTGRPPPTSRPSGGSNSGEACITRILTQLKSEGRLGNSSDPLSVPPKNLKRTPSIIETAQDGLLHVFQKRACSPYTLIFARGTTEIGGMGITVGPALQSGLSRSMRNQWKFIGVSRGYPADMAGNNCIGLTGGVAMLKYLEDEAAACPETKFAMAGYSQGAMAVHNSVAFAKPEVQARVFAAIVFGDPFNGAPIRGFPSEKIKTYCARGDGVCEGKFQISAAHLGYTMGDTSQAVKWIVDQAK